ncbi:hypothetical protein EGI22_21845 [Lacihabitans sp. LS3-19]|nr:hypothetical protein [Lacihabitans sp. LS3-19]
MYCILYFETEKFPENKKLKIFFANFRSIVTFVQYSLKSMKTSNQTTESTKNQSLSIKDCLKLIGIKELTANIYAIPKGDHLRKTGLSA